MKNKTYLLALIITVIALLLITGKRHSALIHELADLRLKVNSLNQRDLTWQVANEIEERLYPPTFELVGSGISSESNGITEVRLHFTAHGRRTMYVTPTGGFENATVSVERNAVREITATSHSTSSIESTKRQVEDENYKVIIINEGAYVPDEFDLTLDYKCFSGVPLEGFQRFKIKIGSGPRLDATLVDEGGTWEKRLIPVRNLEPVAVRQ